MSQIGLLWRASIFGQKGSVQQHRLLLPRPHIVLRVQVSITGSTAFPVKACDDGRDKWQLEAGTITDSRPSGFGSTESACWKYLNNVISHYFSTTHDRPGTSARILMGVIPTRLRLGTKLRHYTQILRTVTNSSLGTTRTIACPVLFFSPCIAEGGFDLTYNLG